MRRRALLTSAGRTALLSTAVALAGCSGLSDPKTPDSGPAKTDSPTVSPTPAQVQTGSLSLTVTDDALTRRNEGSDDELVSVTGTAENTGDEPITDLIVTARFFDDEWTQLGENSIETGELGAGGTWQFELTFGDTGERASAVTNYRLLVDQRDE